jgi:hypothetical protein
MPLLFSNLTNLISPQFIDSDSSVSCSGSVNLPEFLFYSTSSSVINGNSISPLILNETINKLNLCNFSQALAKDVYNSAYTTIVGQVNNSLSTLAATINQTLDVLRCLGYNECILTGPSACCTVPGSLPPAQIKIKLPANLAGPNISYNTQGTFDGGDPVSNNFILPGGPKRVY